MNTAADFGIILPAAGRGARFGGDKLAASVAGATILEHTLGAFLRRQDVAAVALVVADPSSALVQRDPRLVVCAGGAHRSESVRKGLAALAEVGPAFVAVHDAARPAVSQELIERVFEAARREGAAVPGLPVTDTVKEVRGGRAVRTLRRADLVAVQTPQAMRRDWLLDAFARCPIPPDEVTDDVQLLELAGFPVRVVEGEAGNLKVTRPEDLAALERVLAVRGGADSPAR